MRLVRRMMRIFLSGSSQNEVPEKPRWPMVLEEKYLPELEFSGDGVSYPRAQVLHSASLERVQKVSMTSADHSGYWTRPDRISHRRERRRKMPRAVPKSPACPATPPSEYAFSSWTSPCRHRFRHGQISVAAKERIPAERIAGETVGSGETERGWKCRSSTPKG